MDPNQIWISHHAWERFIQRKNTTMSHCPRQELFRLIRVAEQEDLGGAGVIRAMRNGMESVAYYHAEGWRMVFSDDLARLITIERRYLKAKKSRPRRRSMRKRLK